MKLYNDQEVEKLLNDKKIYLIIFLILFAIALAVFITLCFFINDTNKVWIIIVDSFVLSISLCGLFYYFINIFLRDNDLIRHFSKIIVSDKESYNFKVLKYNGLFTHARNIKVFSFLCLVEDKQVNFFLRSDVDMLTIGKTYKGQITNNFIFEYEEI